MFSPAVREALAVITDALIKCNATRKQLEQQIINGTYIDHLQFEIDNSRHLSDYEKKMINDCLCSIYFQLKHKY